jgi:hypothetical protein
MAMEKTEPALVIPSANLVRGKRFVVSLMIATVALAGLYIGLHFAYPASETGVTGRSLVTLDEVGHATVGSEADINWHVGSEAASPHLKSLEERNNRIDEQAASLPDDLGNIASVINRARGGEVPVNCRYFSLSEKLVPYPGVASSVKEEPQEVGDFALILPTLIDNVEQARSDVYPKLTDEDKAQFSTLLKKLRQLQSLRLAQEVSIDNLKTPYGYTLFWMNPFGLIAESVFWTLFGLLTTLIFIICDKLRNNEYSVEEEWPCHAKFIHAPVLTVVIVMMIWNGIMDSMEPSTRTWSIPLLGFLIGVNCRKAMRIVSNLSENVLDRVAEWVSKKVTPASQPGTGGAASATQPPAPGAGTGK